MMWCCFRLFCEEKLFFFFCLVLWWSLLRNFYESCETTLKKPPFQPTLTTYGKWSWKPHTALPTLNREDSFCCWTSIMLWFMKQVCDFYDDKRWKTLYALVWNLYVFSFERAVVNKKTLKFKKDVLYFSLRSDDDINENSKRLKVQNFYYTSSVSLVARTFDVREELFEGILQGVPSSFGKLFVKISNLRILTIFRKKIRQFEGRSTLLC